MPAKKIQPTPEIKALSAFEARERVAVLEEQLNKYSNGYTCYLCGKWKKKTEFHVCTDPNCKTGLSRICRECFYAIALRRDANGMDHSPTKESMMEALEYIDKPFIESVWSSSIEESANLNSGKTRSTPAHAYIKNIGMVQWVGLRWKDSDIFKHEIVYDDEKTDKQLIEEHNGMDTYDSFVKNKEDVIRLLSYDPFEKEDIRDQPLLYSQLLGILDQSEDANDDMMRTSSAISIVRGFNQKAKIDDTLATLMGNNMVDLEKNSATIRSLEDSKNKITATILKEAEDSCISLKHSKNAKKGENTWTGKIKKIKDMNLRSGEVNGFDIMTCRGMQQVQEISDASIMKQLALDESDWSDMVAEMRQTIVDLRKEKDSYQEINRILLRENLDLKDVMSEEGFDLSKDTVNLRELYSKFGEDESSDYEEDEEETDATV